MERSYSQDIDELRTREYPLLNGVTYLDHGGTTPYPQSLIQRYSQDLTSNLFGNPHSASPSSELSTRRIDHVRTRVLDFFKADCDHFDIVFVANATAAIKIVADAFRDVDEPGFWYGYHRDAHTSLVGVRELAAESRCFESDLDVERWLENEDVNLSNSGAALSTGLFAYPAQSNMNGHRLPLDWASRARSSQRSSHRKMYTLLDAAAFVMTAQLDLSDATSSPDFTALSFYKIFGFPDLGALIVRKTAAGILQRRRYFGGGTVDMVTALQTAWHAKKEQTVHEQFEDGTLPFHSIIALDTALTVHAELYGSMANVSRHTCALATNLYRQMSCLRHANGRAACEIYKDPNSQYGNAETQGPTIAFNLRNAQGGWIKKSDVESLAVIHNIHLRTGGVCNPGGIATFCQLSYPEMRKNFSEGMRCGGVLDILGGKPTGIVRVSLGAMSTRGDIQTLIDFVKELFVEQSTAIPVQISPPGISNEAMSVVESLQIFPIIGCSGWKVPKDTSWPVEGTRLAWDEEWCVVHQDNGRSLDYRAHQRMELIHPSLDTEKGLLKLVYAPDAREITIPIWLTASSADQSVQNHHHHHQPLVNLYHSKTVAQFLTSIIGVPCTLAKLQDSRSSKEQVHNRKHIDPTRNINSHSTNHTNISISISTAARGNPHANITLSTSSPTLNDASHIRINHQFFKIIPPPPAPPAEPPSKPPPKKTIRTATIHSLHPLRNPHDTSLTAQHPTLQTGNEIQIFSTSSNHPLDITLTNVDDHICPVWSCGKILPTVEELSRHFCIHGHDGRDGHDARPSLIVNNGKGSINDAGMKKICIPGEWQDEKVGMKSPRFGKRKYWLRRLFCAR